MEGEYKLKVHGRKITIERLSVAEDGVPTKSHATCHKHDQFDIGEGAKVALDRLKDKKDETAIEVGDMVKVVYAGRSYSVIKHFDEPTWAVRYRYGVMPFDGMIAKVVGWYDKEKTAAIIEEEEGEQLGNKRYSHLHCYRGIYVVHSSALKKV